MTFQTPITIHEVLEHIENNQYLLPSIQREFIWSDTKIEWLFDSIMREYPISSFLFWRVEGDTKTNYKFYKFLKDYRERYKTHNEEISTSGLNDFIGVLDGQQRLTSLYIGLKGSYAYKLPRVWWQDNEIALPTRHLYLNIINPLEDEEDGRTYEFKFLTDAQYELNREKWFKVGKILDLGDFFKFNKFLDENNYKKNEFTYKTLSQLHKVIFTKSLINYFLEKEQNIDKALNIFIRINSGGEPLDFSDLLMSIAVANWSEKDARKEINQLVDKIRDKGFFISKDLILKTFLVLYSGDIKFKVTNFSKENAKDFEIKWEQIKLAIHATFDLIKNFGFVDSWLTSKNAVIPIVYYIYHKEVYPDFVTKKTYEEERWIIKKWLHIVLIKRIFGGQADQILSTIRSVFTEDLKKEFIKKEILRFPLKEIQEKLKGTTKDIILDEDFIDNLLLTTKNDNLAFSILALLYPNLDYKNHSFHKDHIHPESFFKWKNLQKLQESEKYEFIYYHDTILNLQLLDPNENESKQDKNLKEWVELESKKQKVSIEKFCENHLIPNILEFKYFLKFIEERKGILKKKLKELVL